MRIMSKEAQRSLVHIFNLAKPGVSDRHPRRTCTFRMCDGYWEIHAAGYS